MTNDAAQAYAHWTWCAHDEDSPVWCGGWAEELPIIWAPGTARNRPELAPLDFWSAGGSCG